MLQLLVRRDIMLDVYPSFFCLHLERDERELYHWVSFLLGECGDIYKRPA
jgi:hypothetical protein